MKKIFLCILCMFSHVACQARTKTTTYDQEITVVPSKKQVSLTFTGDLLFEQGLYDDWNNFQFGSYFNGIKPYLKGDFVIGNLEVPIANMYEIGGIVNLDVVYQKDSNTYQMQNVVLTPIVNHFEEGYHNFALLPFSSYSEKQAQKHYQAMYNADFTCDWISQQLDRLFKDVITMN